MVTNYMFEEAMSCPWDYVVVTNSYNITERINSTNVSHILNRFIIRNAWALVFVSYNFGDCEDYAPLKRKMLIDAGFDRDKIHLCTCFVGGAGHCVLLVETDRGNYILDNNQSEPVQPNFSILQGGIKYRKVTNGTSYRFSFIINCLCIK